MKAPPPASKVTMQYRKGDAWVYELESDGVQVDVHVSARASVNGADEWTISAHRGRGEHALVLTESGKTRAEALNKIVESWQTKTGELALPAFDWQAAVQALVSIRAI